MEPICWTDSKGGGGGGAGAGGGGEVSSQNSKQHQNKGQLQDPWVSPKRLNHSSGNHQDAPWVGEAEPASVRKPSFSVLWVPALKVLVLKVFLLLPINPWHFC